jgi:hypothetical protein
MSIPVALWYEAYVCRHSNTGIAGSNPAEDMDVHLLCLLRVVYVVASATISSLGQMSPTWCVCVCVCLIMCNLGTSKRGDLGLIWAVVPLEKKYTINLNGTILKVRVFLQLSF